MISLLQIANLLGKLTINKGFIIQQHPLFFLTLLTLLFVSLFPC